MKDFLFKKLPIVGAGFAFTIIWLGFIQWLLPKLVSGYNMFTGQLEYTPLGLFFFGCILAPLWEEMAFRHAPLQIERTLREKWDTKLLVPIVAISSAIFGWGHGYGPISILIQGIGGIVLSIVYLKANYNYWASVTLHFMWNFSLMYIFPSFTLKYGIELW